MCYVVKFVVRLKVFFRVDVFDPVDAEAASHRSKKYVPDTGVTDQHVNDTRNDRNKRQFERIATATMANLQQHQQQQ